MTTLDTRSKHGDAADGSSSVILGTRLSRRDGPAKITGVAHYAVEHRPENLAHAVTVQSTIAAGRMRTIDIAAAQAYPRPPALPTAAASSGPVTNPVGGPLAAHPTASAPGQARSSVRPSALAPG